MEKNISKPNARSRSLFSSWTNTLSQVNTEINELSAKKSNITRSINNTSGLIRQLPPKQKEYANLISNRDIAKQVYTNFLSKLEDFKIQEAATMTNVKIIEPASVPDKPVYPKKRTNILIAICLGLFIGLGLILLFDFLDKTPRSIDDIKKVMPYEIMGYLPFLRKESKLFLKYNPNSLPSDAMRYVHANLKYNKAMNQDNTSLMVTSALPSEGKTMVSINLAYTFASTGKRTALINIDMRRPSFSKYLSEDFESGLVNYLENGTDLQSICYNEKNITIIPCGTLPSDSDFFPTNLLNSPKMLDLIKRLKEHYEVVIYDTPPITLIAETLDIAKYINNIMIVIDGSKTSLRDLKEMRDIINGKKLNIVGMVVNNFGKSHIGYKSSYYKYKKNYLKKN
jgi:tyrosine-protein kinase Etk/Wzc